jgi:hypothetical protein
MRDMSLEELEAEWREVKRASPGQVRPEKA